MSGASWFDGLTMSGKDRAVDSRGSESTMIGSTALYET